MLVKTYIVTAALIFLVPAANAEQRIEFKLPNCPSPMTLVAPTVLDGIGNDPEMLAHLAANSARKGTFVLSLRDEGNGIWLGVSELGSIKPQQGTLNDNALDALEPMFQAAIDKLPAGALEYAKSLGSGAVGKVEFESLDILEAWKTGNDLRTTGLAKGDILSLPTTLYTSQLMAVRRGCMSSVIFSAPIDAVKSYDEFRRLQESIQVE